MRVFVAIFPPPGVREELICQARRQPVGGDVRWVKPANVHLTLKFLGEVAAESIDRISETLEPVGRLHGAFTVEPSGFGAFPSKRRARILWAGVTGGSERLEALAGDVEEALEHLGFGREERGYVPHITLGRARGRPVRLGNENVLEAAAFEVGRLDLVESRSGEAGAVYSTLAAFPLGPSGTFPPGEGGPGNRSDREQGTDSHEDKE